LNAQKTPRGTAGENILLFGNDTLDCTDFRQVFKCLGEAKYYGPFRNAINQGAGEHYDLRVGTSFIDLWREWKTSGVKQKSRAIDQVTEEIRRLFEFDRLEISASDQLKTLIVSVNGQPYLLSELGSGLAQFIMVLGNAATSPPTILFIDEPETNLHPALQIDFLLSLARYASEGVVFSTHSVGLARSVAEAIYTAQRKGTSTIFRPFEATPNYMEFIGELSFSTFKDLGSDRILLVEGVNDVKTVQQLLRLYGKDHTTVILPLGGDQLTSGREMELSELTRLSGNICAIVDSERNNSGGAAKASRQDFEQVCKKIGIKSCVTERRALENYFTDRSVKAALGDSYVALTPFQKLKDAARPWSKVENWKIARQMEISELESSDVGVFLASI
jgi:energy-coupling factor transporter ATP-binding protein EcfA2